MGKTRQDTFKYESMPWIGKFSSRIATSLVVDNLVPGTWLDVLSGARALLQRSQLANRSIRRFYALDHAFDEEVSRLGICTTELHLERTLPYAEESFENVTIINGLEHLWYPDDIVAEAFRVLKVGGVLQLMVPTWFGKPFLEFLAFTLQNPAAYLEMNDHKMYYNEQTLWPMLVRAGFQPRAIRLRRVKMFCSLHAHARKLR